VLEATSTYQNQHIMGWGTTNPEPSPGVYDWSDLDRRVALMRNTGAQKVITLCCAPDWMKGGKPGTTNWNNLAGAPYPSHYGDFAALAKRVAQRYPDVKRFQVWNEFKGFYNTRLNRWDYEDYTTFYNDVYAALKSVSPNVQVGGPYMPMDTWLGGGSNPSKVRGAYGTIDQRAFDGINYWLAHKRGADFIAIDGGLSAKDGNLTDWFAAAQYYADIDRWIRTRTNLPIEWAEWYSSQYDSNGNVVFDHARQNAQAAATLTAMARSGASVALRWQPQGVRGYPFGGDQESLWSDTQVAGGGYAFPFAATSRAFAQTFPPGTPLVRAVSSDPEIAVLASRTTTLLVNGHSSGQQILLDGSPLTLGAYGVVFVQTPHRAILPIGVVAGARGNGVPAPALIERSQVPLSRADYHWSMTQAPARILVVDDERHIRELLEIGLSDDGYDVGSAPDGEVALQIAHDWSPDAIVLDIMLRKIDGIALLPMFRELTEAPIVMLSARTEMSDKIAGLHGGADDYVAKPFEMGELVARLETALRRPRLAQPTVLRFADLEVNLETRAATRGNKRIALSAREYDLLVTFLRNPNRIFSRDQLLDAVWGTDRYVGPGAVETYVSYLRAKIDHGFPTRLLHTHRGVGYALRES